MGIPIKILHVLPSLSCGGMEKALWRLIKETQDYFTHEVFCIDSGDISKNEFYPKLADLGVNITGYAKQAGFKLNLLQVIRSKIIQDKFNIVHARNFASILYASLSATGLREVKVIADIRGQYRSKSFYILKFLSPLIFKYVAVSENIRNAFVDNLWIRSEKIIMIYNGIETFLYKMNEISNDHEKQILNGCSLIGTVGRLSKVKDYPTLLSAFEHVQRHIPNTKLMVVGDGQERIYLEKIVADKRLGEKVIFVGFSDKVEKYYKMFDIFVLTSIREGLSNVIMEAMSYGLPVVATSVGGNPEIVKEGETGYIVQPGKPEEVAEKLIMLLKNRTLRESFGQKGQKLINDNFSSTTNIRQYINLYHNCMEAAS